MGGVGAEGDAHILQRSNDLVEIRSAGNDLACLRIYGAITIKNDGLG